MSLNTQTIKSAKKSFPSFKRHKTPDYDFRNYPDHNLVRGQKYVNKKTRKKVVICRLSFSQVIYEDNNETEYNMKPENFKHFYEPYERKDRLEII